MHKRERRVEDKIDTKIHYIFINDSNHNNYMLLTSF